LESRPFVDNFHGDADVHDGESKVCFGHEAAVRREALDAKIRHLTLQLCVLPRSKC
jgi:hypothetical protein